MDRKEQGKTSCNIVESKTGFDCISSIKKYIRKTLEAQNAALTIGFAFDIIVSQERKNNNIVPV